YPQLNMWLSLRVLLLFFLCPFRRSPRSTQCRSSVVSDVYKILFLMLRRPSRSKLGISSAATDVYKQQTLPSTDTARGKGKWKIITA
ncbi:hypothetical protein C7U80_13070, partial [Escherichia coli]